MDRTYVKAIVIALIAMTLMIAVWWWLYLWYRNNLVEDYRSSVFRELAPYSYALSAAIQQRVSLLEALCAFVLINPSEADLDEDFGDFASYLHATSSGIHLIALAPDGVIQYVYPAEHEGLQGRNLMEDTRPELRNDIDWAVNSRQIVISGPYELATGEQGIVARKAVFDGDFRGIASLVLKVRPLLVEAGIIPGSSRLKLALVGAEGKVLYKENRVLEADPVQFDIHLPGKTWILSAVPENGWWSGMGIPLRQYRVAGLLFIGLFTFLIFMILAYQQRLKNAVSERTKDLSRELNERLQAQAALHKREEQFRALAELAPTGIAILGGGDTYREKYVYVNRAWEELTGYSKREAESIRPIDLVHPDMREVVEQKGDARLRGEPVESRYIVKLLTKKGTSRWVDFSAIISEFMGDKVVVTVSHDITRQKKAEEALRKSEANLRDLISKAPIGIFRSSSEGYFLTVNPAMARILGFDSTEAAMESYADLANQFYANPEVRAFLLRKLLKDQYVEDFEIEARRMDGTKIFISLNARVSESLSDEAFAIDGFAVDITHRRETQERILHLNRVLRSLREISLLFYTERDPEQLVQQICNSLIRNRGYFGAMIVRTDDNNYPVQVALSGNQEAFDPILRSFDNGIVPPCCLQDHSGVVSRQLMPRSNACKLCKPGKSCPITGIACKPLQYENTIFGYIAVAQLDRQKEDGEERELFTRTAYDLAFALHNIQREEQTREVEQARDRAEEQLLQAQKMEAVGRLAGGVAHDFNNMLNVILGYASIARTRLNKDDVIYNYILEIEQAAQRSANLTGQLLAFSRKQITAPRVVDLNEIVQDQQTLLSRLIGEEIEIRFYPEDDLWSIRIDPFQVDQILTNLTVNSRDAIEGMGTVIIKTENIHLNSMKAPPEELPAGDYVLLTFIDTGSGMDQQTMEQIFEPFYTTKETGRGTGLGLSTVYGIVKQNNGAITVESQPGEGTTFRIFFPRHADETSAAAVGPSERQVAGNETILIVEDEEQVLNLAAMILKDLGYNVLKAKSPGMAMDMTRNHPGTIDLLLTDVIMPEMNGRELKERIEEILPPGIKTMYMSGYTDDVIAKKGIIDEQADFVVKPFTVEFLAEKVREVLDRNDI